MEQKAHTLAYHIVWTTYGTWLSGDVRGWIKKGHAGIKHPDWRLEDRARERMEELAVLTRRSVRLSKKPFGPIVQFEPGNSTQLALKQITSMSSSPRTAIPTK